MKSNQPIDARGCGREAPYEDEFLASWIYPRLGGSDCRPLLMAHVMIGLGPDAPELAGVLAGALVEIIEKSGGRAVRRSGSEVIGLWGLTEMTRDEPSLVVAATAEIRAMGAAANIRSVLHAHVVRVPRGAEVMHDVGIALTAAWDEVRTIATMADAIIVTDSFRSACGAIPGLVPLGGAATGPHVPLVYALPDAMAADAIRSLQQSALPSIVDWTANLDELGDLRPLMLAAAIAGTSFSIDLLARMLDIDPLRLQPALEAACASGLIEAETLQGRRCSFTFRDRELHRTAYDAVPAANRLRLHRKAALAAREASAADGLERPEIVAHHHLLGQDPQQSKRWLGKAARQAIARGESGKAIAYLEQALEQDGGTKNATNALNRSLLQLLGVQQAVTKGNGSDAVVDAYQRSMALAGETATLAWGQEFRSLWLAQSCHLVKGEVRAALIIGNLLINHLNRRAAHAENAIGRRILVHRMQGLALMLCGRFDQSFAQYDKVLEYYDPAQHAALRFAYGSDQAALTHAHRAWGYAIMGDSARALEATRIARATADRLAHPHTTAHVMAVVAIAAQSAKAYGEAWLAAHEARAIAVEHGFEYWVAWADVMLAADRARTSPRDGYEMLIAAKAAYRATDATQLCPVIYASLSAAALNDGRHRLALEHADAGLALAAQNGCVLYRPELYRRRARALFAVGDHGHANAALLAGYDEAVQNGAKLFSARITRDGIKHSRGQQQIAWHVRAHSPY